MSNSPTTTKPTFTTDSDSFDTFTTLGLNARGVRATAYESETPHLSLDVHKVERLSTVEVTTASGVSVTINTTNEHGISTAFCLYGISRDDLVAALNDAWVIAKNLEWTND